MNLCVSLKEVNFTNFSRKMQNEKFVEIRLDDAILSDDEIDKLFSKEINNDIKTIATCRKGFYNDLERKEILIKAISSGVDYIDIEIGADEKFKRNIIQFANKKQCKVIVSYHNYKNTLPKNELDIIIKKCTILKPDIIKIATKVNSDSDQNILLSLYNKSNLEKKLLVIGMGEKGVLSRLKALDLGAPFTFVSKTEGEETADGQISKEKFLKLLSFMNSKKIFAVTGNPILHSKSPVMFNSVFKDNLDDFENTYLKLASDSAKESISLFKSLGLRGMNVTAPYKKEIMNELDYIDEKARIIGGVNTIVSDYNGKLTGYNTDFIGVQKSLENKNINISDKKILVLGAGGASKGLIYALKDIEKNSNIKANSITIVNRTISKAKEIAKKFECSWSSIDELPSLLKEIDILISTLSADIDMIKEDWLRKETIIFDANYKSSKLIQLAEKIGSEIIIKGEQWLLNQAIPAYRYFTNKNVSNIEKMKTALQKDIFLGKKYCITLIGAMGSGKTVIGKSLAKKLDWNFIDIDEEIIQGERRSITEIFETDSEQAFRTIENKYLTNIFSYIKKNSNRKTIISCGGGIVLNEDNRDIIKNKSTCIWLYSSPEIVLKRLENSNNRPLLKGDDILETTKKIFERRKFLYASTADMVVRNDNGVDSIVEKIINEIQIL